MNKYQLAAILASYEIDEPHSNYEHNCYPYFTEDKIKYWSELKHDGDCISQPQPCTRCFADELLFKSEWLLTKLKEEGYIIEKELHNPKNSMYYSGGPYS